MTGGYVESAVFEEAQEVLRGAPPRLRAYGISDATAAGVGLMCGGTVHVFIRELDRARLDVSETAAETVVEQRGAALATLLDGPSAGASVAVADGRVVGSFELSDKLDAAVGRDALGDIAHGVATIRRFGAGGEVMGDDLRVFIDAFSMPRDWSSSARSTSASLSRRSRSAWGTG